MNRHLSVRSTAGIRLAAWLLAVASLAGCGILPKQETVTLYDPTPQRTATQNPAATAWPQVDWQLRISRPYADAMHDSARILVRPQPGELQVYKGAAWTQPAPDLVLDTLVRAFADSGRFAGIARRGEGVSGQYELLLDLRRFESDYDGGATPGARIELGARLVHNADNRVIASRVFDVTVPADGTDVVQITRAFEQAIGDATTQLIGWTLSEGESDTGRRP